MHRDLWSISRRLTFRRAGQHRAAASLIRVPIIAGLGLVLYASASAGPNLLAIGNFSMPVPVRYIPIRNVLEDDIAAALERSMQAMKAQLAEDRTWGGDADLARRVLTTARVANALAELDPMSEDVKQAMQWLAKQTPSPVQPWGLETVASRLYCLARHGGLAEFGPAIQSDVQFLIFAQAKDGGWADRTAAAGGASAVVNVAASNHDDTVRVLAALREARFAGAEHRFEEIEQALRVLVVFSPCETSPATISLASKRQLCAQ